MKQTKLRTFLLLHGIHQCLFAVEPARHACVRTGGSRECYAAGHDTAPDASDEDAAAEPRWNLTTASLRRKHFTSQGRRGLAAANKILTIPTSSRMVNRDSKLSEGAGLLIFPGQQHSQ